MCIIAGVASHGMKLTLKIVGGVVGLILIAGIALVGWVMFRPLLAGDYNTVRTDITTISSLNSTPLEAMVATVGAPIDAQAAENLDNRILNSISQIGVLQESVASAKDSRAYDKDDDLKAQLDTLDEQYSTLKSTYETWQTEGYATIGWAARSCGSVGYSASNCADAVAAITTEPTSPELVAIVDAARSTAKDPDFPEEGVQATDAALVAFSEANNALWTPIPEQVAAIDTYLVDHGAE